MLVAVASIVTIMEHLVSQQQVLLLEAHIPKSVQVFVRLQP